MNDNNKPSMGADRGNAEDAPKGTGVRPMPVPAVPSEWSDGTGFSDGTAFADGDPHAEGVVTNTTPSVDPEAE